MAYSRAYKFPANILHLSLICKAFSHPARIEIIHLLNQKGKATFNQINNLIPLHSTTVSQHLRFLREMNIIIGEDKEPFYYRLNRKLPQAHKDLIDLATKSQRSFSC